MAGPGCAPPRASIILGAATTVAASTWMMSIKEPSCEPDDPAFCFGLIGQSIDYNLSRTGAGLVIGAGAAILISGLARLDGSSTAKEKEVVTLRPLTVANAGTARDEAATTAATATAATTVTTTTATAANDPGAAQQRLLLQIRLAARANRCAAASFMMQKLTAVNRELARAAIEGDEHVARCAAPAIRTSLQLTPA